MKRTVFLAVALFALMAVSVFAQTEADFTVKKSADGKSITITRYKGTAKDVKIPEKIQDLSVTSIGNGAFQANVEITSVVIPNGVTSIGSVAFESCTSLTSVTIPDSVTIIGSGAFYNCANLTSVTFVGSIPSSGFHANAFSELGDIRAKYLAAGGGAGTYTRPSGSTTWTKQAASTAAPAAATPAAFSLNGVWTRSDGMKITITENGQNITITGDKPNNGGKLNDTYTKK
jgi:hypothetical protein